jgi:glutamate-1-semialdehyde 2,1-aminomutase
MNFDNSKKLQDTAHRLIPGGAHTYAKGDDQFPQLSPGFIARGSGCHVWDVDGNEYIEYGMGLRAVTLGHAYPSVVEAAKREMLNGSNFNRPARIEIECAEKMLHFIDGDNMVKFTKDGSSVTSAAVKLARAFTGRDKVAICADHPFFSYDDWFIGTTAIDAGIPRSVKALSVTFRYNDIESVKAMFEQHPNEIACLIMEPVKGTDPINNFLHEVKRICHENGALFILDEMICGFRLHTGGGQKYFDVQSDMSTWGKALANGFALSALVGKREIMELGGLRTKKERVFLLSTTHGAETHALAAAIATMDVYEKEPVIETLDRQGSRLQAGLNQVIDEYGLRDYFGVEGKPCNLIFFTRDQHKKPSQHFRALFMQEMIKHGILGKNLIVSYSHTNDDIDKTIEAAAGSLAVYRKALENGVELYLVGGPTQSVYRKLN